MNSRDANRFWVRMPVVLIAAAVAAAMGCHTATPEYARPLPPGQDALHKVGPGEMPDLASAARGSDGSLIKALDNSLSWFAKPSARQYFPLNGISYDQAYASVFAFRQILGASTVGEFLQRFHQDFDVYTSVGWDGSGVVLFTGYYSPVLSASRVRTSEYRYPLYKRPADLVSDPATGDVRGRSVNGQIVPYPTRAEIERNALLAGQEFVWLADKMDCYIVQIQGSAKLNMTDGTTMLIGYAGNNGHEYTSIGGLLAQSGKLNKNKLSLPLLRNYFHDHPDELDEYTQHNDRFVFFKEYQQNNWPAGSLGVEVTDYRSLAVNKAIYPRGMATLVATAVPTESKVAGQTRSFTQFMADQDTGGAFRAPGRADIYFGTGQQAEDLAGMQMQEGRLYYIVLKPESVSKWQAMMRPSK